MTITQDSPVTKHALWFRSAGPLIRALSNGILFSYDDASLPALNCIKFEFEAGALRTVSTDRYRLCIEEVELDPQIDQTGVEPFEFLLPRVAAVNVLRVLKASKYDSILLTHDADNHTATFKTLVGASSHETYYFSSFVPYQQLIPTAGDEEAHDRVAFSPAFLADLGKVLTANHTLPPKQRAGDRITIRFNKPTLVEFTDGPTVVLMPIKLAD